MLQGSSAVGSTVVAVLFYSGLYLLFAPDCPRTLYIGLYPETVVKKNQRGEVIEVRWDNVTRIKEEFFPNGKRISISVFRKPAGPKRRPKSGQSSR